MISNSFLNEVKNILDTSRNFSSNDFKLDTQSGKLKIIYEYLNSYFLEVEIPISLSKLSRTEQELPVLGLGAKQREVGYEEFVFKGTARPGSVSNSEHLNIEGKDSLKRRISQWTNDLWSELMMQPQLRKVKELEEEMKNLNEKFDSFPEDFFTQEEARKMSARLDAIEQQLKEKLELEIRDKLTVTKALKELHQEIEKLKLQTKVLN